MNIETLQSKSPLQLQFQGNFLSCGASVVERTGASVVSMFKDFWQCNEDRSFSQQKCGRATSKFQPHIVKTSRIFFQSSFSHVFTSEPGQGRQSFGTLPESK